MFQLWGLSLNQKSYYDPRKQLTTQACSMVRQGWRFVQHCPGCPLRKREHLSAETALLTGFVEGSADFVAMGAMGTDGLMELITGDAELFRPVGDVR